jgi:DNA-binding IclR family transcriptional regulator
MSTVGKALLLPGAISTFSDDVGFSAIAQRCGLDKATARGFLADPTRSTGFPAVWSDAHAKP